mmetsp:Transcript_40000/g.96516  ORF Transcript_40000/g.96516 Transcript_40000/m.96516 type:complete len:375 (-) Transcript_40000:1394-2518(-)
MGRYYYSTFIIEESPTYFHCTYTVLSRFDKVMDIRQDQTLVVRISSWRLARRSVVTCYLSKGCVRVVQPIPVSRMNIYEKIEHAQDLKAEASVCFTSKRYQEALALYAKAVDTVRYIQHDANSSNENRADLLVVMISCCNNAGTSCYQLKQWEDCIKFGQSALNLLEALYRKRETSKLLEVLRQDGFNDSKLFGIWRVKSLLLVSRGLLGRSLPEEAIKKLKTASDIISSYKSIEPGLSGLEKEVRNTYNRCKHQSKLNKQKEKQRAVAMFGGPMKDDGGSTNTASHKSASTNSSRCSAAKSHETEPHVSTLPSKPNVKAAYSISRKGETDGQKPEADPDEEPSFVEKHKEFLLCVLAGVVGSVLIFNTTTRRW